METANPGEPFLPHLGRLMAQLQEGTKTYDEHVRVSLQLKHLPYTIKGMETALEQFLLTALDVIRQHPVESPAVVSLIRPFLRDRLNLFVDLFLDTARRTQNALLPFLRRRYRVETPNSLAEYMKRLDREAKISPEMARLIREYWAAHGKRLKDYRDLAQHHALVASDARVTMRLDGRPILYLTLPNNPEEKSAIKHRYSDPIVHATDYLGFEFEALIRLCHEAVRLMIDPTTNPPRGVSFRFPEGLKMGPGTLPVGTIVPSVEEINARFTALLTDLNARLKAENGPGG